MESSELIEKIKNNDQEAFRQFVDRYYPLVLRTCVGFVHSLADAEDLAQEVFVEVYKSVGRFRKESKISTWIYRIAVNKSLNFIRDNKKFSFFSSIETLLRKEESGALESNEDVSSLEKDESEKVLHKAIDSLPKNQRIAFTLNKYDDLSYKEVAEIMDVSIASVESLIHRAKKNLQKKLVGYFRNY